MLKSIWSCRRNEVGNIMKKTEDNYISIHFSQIHEIDKIEKEYSNYFKFFCGNYKRHVPTDRNAKILDMGCGLGETLFSLHKLGYRNVTGIDFSQECVDFCNKMKFAKCRKGDALEYFQRIDEQYDVIFFNDIIEHFLLEDVIRILNGMRRCLNRGGGNSNQDYEWRKRNIGNNYII